MAWFQKKDPASVETPKAGLAHRAPKGLKIFPLLGVDVVLYPPDGTVDLALGYRGLAQAWEAVCCGKTVTAVLLLISWPKQFLDHVLGFGALTLLVWNAWRKRLSTVHPAFVVIAMLFLTVAAQFALTVTAEHPLQRYMLPGEMAMHLLYLLAVFVCAKTIADQHRNRKRAGSRQ